MQRTETLVLVGPTAVGKSRLALLLAESLGGEIINADALQAYRGLDIGTAKPTPEERQRMGGIVAKAMAEMGYRGAGTIEFLWENGEFYFIEMNTRLQVEHPVTEAITGVDLVREQIRVADGKPLSVSQEDIEFKGHAIECRINAEDPFTHAPSPGLVTAYHAAGGMHVRVDSGLYAGYRIPPYYDSMIAKLIVYGRTREGCIMRLRRALEEMVVEGVKTSIPLHAELLRDPDVLNGDYSIKWLEDWLARRGSEG